MVAKRCEYKSIILARSKNEGGERNKDGRFKNSVQ